jgi:hypothetical protein
MGDQINDQAVQLTAAAPVQLESFTLPAGTYPGVTRRSSDDSRRADEIVQAAIFRRSHGSGPF